MLGTWNELNKHIKSPDSGFLSHYVAVTLYLSLPGGLGCPSTKTSQPKLRICQEESITYSLNAGPQWSQSPVMSSRALSRV